MEVFKRLMATRGFPLGPRYWLVERGFVRTNRYPGLARDDERLAASDPGFGAVAFAGLMRQWFVTVAAGGRLSAPGNNCVSGTGSSQGMHT